MRTETKRWIMRIEWPAKMILGWCCHAWVMHKRGPPELTQIGLWALSWAGYYANDTGFEDWLYRKNLNSWG